LKQLTGIWKLSSRDQSPAVRGYLSIRTHSGGTSGSIFAINEQVNEIKSPKTQIIAHQEDISYGLVPIMEIRAIGRKLP
jgi:hypothetical protein